MTDGPLAVYVHWPFCLSKCPYCDFNSHVRDSVDQPRWRRALLDDLSAEAVRTGGRPIASVFFGGGTPSLMPPETVAAVIDRIAALWPMAGDVEITLEANPTSVEADRLADFRNAGVNRVSLGVQALDDEALAFLGRGHSAAEAIAAVATARGLFDRVSFDLIYARPGQTVGAWTSELAEALTYAADHLSLYQLTIEPGTAFGNRAARGESLTAADPAAADLYAATQETLERAGLPAYEISNHARPGAESRHNLAYWRYQDYLGVGPGAHGRVTRHGDKTATERIRAPEAWLAAVERSGHGVEAETKLGPEDRFTEMLMMGLRLAEGVAADRVHAETGRDLSEWIADDRQRDLVEGGFLESAADGLRATADGRMRLNAVIAHLLA